MHTHEVRLQQGLTGSFAWRSGESLSNRGNSNLKSLLLRTEVYNGGAKDFEI